MRLKLIACNVLLRQICRLVSESSHVFDLEFTEYDAHDQSDILRQDLQTKIDTCMGKNYDAILLGYGLCGNSCVGISARDTQVVIPRAHDCCTIFLGSKE